MSDFDSNNLRQFLIEAKRHTYAAVDASAVIVTSAFPGGHQLEYAEGDFSYRDLYYGGYFFVGQETVHFRQRPVWSMAYSGGNPAELIGKYPGDEFSQFLRAVLRQLPAEHPYRGPAAMQSGLFSYQNQIEGTFDHFWGHEIISYGDLGRIYQLHYSGGAIRE
ncbi:MAG TPA: DUF5680 domain-containing protein [Phototrophicaceae bacterium]|nr:DUF5680 domain-containing protein [Phototrophicaceae bacterium]